MDLVRTRALRPAESRSPWATAVVRGSLLWLVTKCFVSFLSGAVELLHGGVSVTDRAAAHPLDTGLTGFFAVLQHWDSGYFLRIAEGGYLAPGSGSSIRAFFPGFPVLSRALSNVFFAGPPTAAGLVVSMWIVSSVASCGAAVLLFRLADQLHSSTSAAWSTLFFLAGPYSVFLFADYSESLFLLFAVAAWYNGVRSRWWWVGLLAAAATFTRINGLFLVAALAVMYVLQRRRAGRSVLAPELCWLPISLAGIGSYFLYLKVETGDSFAWFHAQAEGWRRGLFWPWQSLYQTAGRVLLASTPDRRIQFALDLVFAVLIAGVATLFIRRRQWPEATYLVATLIVFVTSFTLVSVARNSLTLFPMFILAGSTFVSLRNRAARVAIVVFSLGLFVVNATLFANGYWAD